MLDGPGALLAATTGVVAASVIEPGVYFIDLLLEQAQKDGLGRYVVDGFALQDTLQRVTAVAAV